MNSVSTSLIRSNLPDLMKSDSKLLQATKSTGPGNPTATIAQLFEHLLFQSSPNLKVYSDLSTIESRLKDIGFKLLQRRLQRRKKYIGGFRTKMVIGKRSSPAAMSA